MILFLFLQNKCAQDIDHRGSIYDIRNRNSTKKPAARRYFTDSVSIFQETIQAEFE